MEFKNDNPFSHQGIQISSFLNSTQFVKERKDQKQTSYGRKKE